MNKLKKILCLCTLSAALCLFAGSFTVARAQALQTKQNSPQYNWNVNQQQNDSWMKPIQTQKTDTKSSADTASTSTGSKNSGNTSGVSSAVKTGLGIATTVAIKAAGTAIYPAAPAVGEAVAAKALATTSEAISTASEIHPDTDALKKAGVVATAGVVGAVTNPLMPTAGLSSAMTAADQLIADKENQCAGAKPISNTDALHPDAAGLFDNSILTDMQTMLHKLYKTFGLLFMVGHGLLCYATMGKGLLTILETDWPLPFPAPVPPIFIPNWNLLFSGIVIYFFAIILAMAVGLYFVDIAFKLGFAVLMLPVSIGLWPFKPTSKKLSENVSIIVRNAMLFTLMSIGLSFCIVLIMEGVFSGGVLDWGQFWEALETNNTGKMVENFSLFSMHTLVMAFCIIYGLKILAASIEDYLKYLFNDSVFGSESPVHRLSTQAVGMATNFAVKPVFKLAGDVAVHQTGEAIAAVGESIEKLGSYEGREGFRQNFKHVFSRGSQQQAFNSSDTDTSNDKKNGIPPITPVTSGGGTNTPPPPSAPVERNENGFFTLPNGDEVNGLGKATRNDDGGITFTSVGADGSRSIVSYDKNGNRHVQTFNGAGKMTSDYRDNKDGSASGFITKDDGTIQRWDDPPGTFKDVGAISAIRERNSESATPVMDTSDTQPVTGDGTSTPPPPPAPEGETTPSTTETPNEQTTPDRQDTGRRQQRTDGQEQDTPKEHTNETESTFRTVLGDVDRMESIRPAHILDQAATGALQMSQYYTLKMAKALNIPFLNDIISYSNADNLVKSVRSISELQTQARANLQAMEDERHDKKESTAKFYLKKSGNVALRTAKGAGEDSAKVVGGLLKGFGRALADSTKEKGKKPKKTFLQQLCEKSAYQAYLEAQERKRDEKAGKGEDSSYYSTLADQ